jgi:CheY-like chemotaxis protein
VEAAAGKPGPRLLSVDDNVDSAELVARIAIKCGYEAQVASTAAEIRAALAEWKPDLIALDLSMPELNGLDLLRLLQEGQFQGRVIIISGHDDFMRASAGRLAEARGIAVVGDLQKPIDNAQLRELLQNTLG